MTITTYDTYTLSTEEELARCPVFHVDQFNWGGSYRPLTTGRLGFLPGTGFLLEMECQETDPAVPTRRITIRSIWIPPWRPSSASHHRRLNRST